MNTTENSEIRQLNADELDEVSGGFHVDPPCGGKLCSSAEDRLEAAIFNAIYTFCIL
jgi:hypothetical protein